MHADLLEDLLYWLQHVLMPSTLVAARESRSGKAIGTQEKVVAAPTLESHKIKDDVFKGRSLGSSNTERSGGEDPLLFWWDPYSILMTVF